MNTAQKSIKGLAYALAYFLAFVIISSIVATVAALFGVIGLIGGGSKESPVDCSGYEKCLSISLNFSELEIKKGEELGATAEDSRVEIEKDGNKLVIKDIKKGGFFNRPNRKIAVTVPEDLEFEAVGIGDRGGKIVVEKLTTGELELELGAGETIFEYLTVTNHAKVDAGVGRFEIQDGAIKNADIHLGVGEAKVRSALTGDSKIDAGIGSVKLDLLLPDSAYAVKVDKGIGRITFNGVSAADGSIFGSGDNFVDVDGGIGQIEIDTAEEAPAETKTEEPTETETKTETEVEVEAPAKIKVDEAL